MTSQTEAINLKANGGAILGFLLFALLGLLLSVYTAAVAGAAVALTCLAALVWKAWQLIVRDRSVWRR